MEKGFTIELPPHGYVRYIDHMGDDLRIVEAARVSYGEASKGEELDNKLREYLFKNRHTSPFEQGIVAFNIKMPIFVMRQLVRHRTFRLNEYSGRYSEMPDEFYEPEVWRRQNTQGNKQGSIADDGEHWNNYCDAILAISQKQAFHDYQTLLEAGVAKELARIVLPVSIYTGIYMNCDLHNLMHFFYLRTDSHAQKEIQDFANAMLKITQELFPHSIALWDKYQPKMVEIDRIRKI